MVAGALLLLLGGAVAGYGAQAGGDLLQTVGGAAAAVGLHVLAVGIILSAAGRSRSRRASTLDANDFLPPASVEGAQPATAAASMMGRKVAIMMVALVGLLAVLLAIGMVGRGG